MLACRNARCACQAAIPRISRQLYSRLARIPTFHAHTNVVVFWSISGATACFTSDVPCDGQTDKKGCVRFYPTVPLRIHFCIYCDPPRFFAC